jgi:hypothetical protein
MDLYLDRVTNDLELENGDLRLVADEQGAPAETEQRVLVTFRTDQGEWTYNTNFGVGYRLYVLSKNPDLAQVEAHLIDKATGIETIERVNRMDVSLDHPTRHATVIGELETVFGLAQVEV